MTTFEHQTFIPLYLQLKLNGSKIGNGTGFVVKYNKNPYLITNWHVVTGRNPETGKPLDTKTGIADPNEIIIWHHLTNTLDTWVPKVETLIDSLTHSSRWLEHPKGKAIDVIALPLTIDTDIQFYDLDLNQSNAQIYIPPADIISVIGFPKGLPSDGMLPFWITGFVATEIDFDYKGKPVFYINAPTTEGLSGSPVFAKRMGAVCKSRGQFTIGEGVKFLGVYSGRKIHDNVEGLQIGMVWKSKVISEIFSHNIKLNTDLTKDKK